MFMVVGRKRMEWEEGGEGGAQYDSTTVLLRLTGFVLRSIASDAPMRAHTPHPHVHTAYLVCVHASVPEQLCSTEASACKVSNMTDGRQQPQTCQALAGTAIHLVLLSSPQLTAVNPFWCCRHSVSRPSVLTLSNTPTHASPTTARAHTHTDTQEHNTHLGP